MRRRVAIAFAGLLVAGLVFVAYLARAVLDDLAALSTAEHDDISWTLSQLEVETLNLRRAAHDLAHGHTGDLSAFRRRFDIYYSRVATLTRGPAYQALRGDPAAREALAALEGFLRATVPLVDGPDAALLAGMARLQTRTEALRPQARALALAGLQVFARADAARRAALSLTLIKLAGSGLVLVLVLLGALAVLIGLIRRGQRVAHDHAVARARFEAAVSSSLDAVLVVDTGGRVIEFNGAAETVFGYGRAEVLGRDMADLIVPEHLRAMHRRGMARFLATGDKTVIGAGRIRLEGLRKSGEVFPVELSISLSEADGERVFVSFLRDITPELTAEAALRAARDAARQSERAKSDLLTVMSHEMRTPLNGILGSLALIDRAGLSAAQRRHLEAISVSGELLISHVNDVLDLSRLDAGATPPARDPFDLDQLVHQTADSLTAAAMAQGNRLTARVLSAPLGSVMGARRALQQVLVNLLGNAIKFTTNGEITLEAERLDDPKMVEIRVSDTGIGIRPEDLERIFEDFVTIDTAYARARGGTGLGLAITRRLVAAMEGEITVDSLPGEGSLFTLRLPLSLPGAAAARTLAAPTAALRRSAPRAGLRALVVDDNEINRMVLGEMLRALGAEVCTADGGRAALAQVAERAWDVVFLDISMPEIDGIETLRRIRALEVPWREVPAIAVTAHAAPKDHAVILEAPFADLLVKPVRPQELSAKLAALAPAPAQAEAPTEHDSFRAQFGDARYHAELAKYRRELAEVLARMERGQPLPPPLLEEVHRLAGSAGVLGLQTDLALLQNLEGQGRADPACCDGLRRGLA